MPEATNGDVKLFFTDEGTGEAILLIHGHTMDGRVWDPVMPDLQDAGLRILRADLRGHGRSTRPDFGYHLSHHAADMVAVLDEAGLRRVVVVGYSIGGAIALEMAVTCADRVSGLVLMAPVMPDRPFEPAFMDNLKMVARVARTEGIAAAMAGPWAESPLLGASLEKPGIREKVEAITRDFPGAEYLATQRDRVERSWAMPERLREIDRPTTVVVGELEMAGFRAYAEEAAGNIPGAHLKVLNDCGHLLPLEEPHRIAEEIVALSTKTFKRSNV